MKELLGVSYFEPEIDPTTNDLRTVYKGKVIAFLVRRDDGSEFEIRKEHRVNKNEGVPLRKQDLETLKVGSKVAFLGDSVAHHEVIKVFPIYGDVWVRNLETKKDGVCKYHELKRATEANATSTP